MMRQTVTSVGLLLFLIIIKPVVAQTNWVLIDQNNEMKVYVDTGRLKQTENGADVWIRYEHKVIQESSDHTFRFDEFLSHDEVKCEGMQVRYFGHVAYLRGRVSDSYSSSYPGEWSITVPGSFGETIVTEVCRYVGTPATP